MKDGHIYLFKDFRGLACLATVLHVKEQFFNNSFIKEGNMLIALNEDLTFRKTILLKKIKPHLIKDSEYTVEKYTKEHAAIMKKVYEYKEKHHVSLSWLEIFQITALLKEQEVSEESISIASANLQKFYRDLETNF